MSQENLQTMIMQNFWEVEEVYCGIVRVVNCKSKNIIYLATCKICSIQYIDQFY